MIWVPTIIPIDFHLNIFDARNLLSFPLDLVFESCHPVSAAREYFDTGSSVLIDGHGIDQSQLTNPDPLIAAGDRPERLDEVRLDLSSVN